MSFWCSLLVRVELISDNGKSTYVEFTHTILGAMMVSLVADIRFISLHLCRILMEQEIFDSL